jgi:L-threonylcarbamoyladenylate synthase
VATFSISYDVRVTDVIRVAAEDPDPAAIARAAECLRRGGLVAFPTETVYGLGVDALNRTAVQRLFAAKQRPPSDPLIVHINSIESISLLAAHVPDSALALGQRFWPGPLTLVLPRSPRVPDEVTAGLPSVAIRVPMHPVARALINAAAVPVAAPSANLFSRPSATQAAHVLEDLDGRIDLIVDGGATTIGVESTVLDLTTNTPTVLRPGAVTIEMLREVIPRVETLTGYDPRHEARQSALRDGGGIRDSGAAMRSPGMLEKHYSPRAELTLFEGVPDTVLPGLVAAASAALAAGKSVGVIAAEEDRDALSSLPSHSRLFLRTMGSQAAPDVVAAKLYATLRELDAAGADTILVRSFPDHGLWAAVQDRLRRAAAGRIVTS